MGPVLRFPHQAVAHDCMHSRAVSKWFMHVLLTVGLVALTSKLFRMQKAMGSNFKTLTDEVQKAA